MADAAIVTVAKAVVEDLNTAGRWSQQFAAVRRYKPKATFEELNTLNVQVALAAWRTSPDNRTDWEHEFEIDIGFMYRADANEGDQAIDAFDKVILLVEEVVDYFQLNRPSQGDCPLRSVSLGTGGDQPYLPDHIESNNQISSIIKLTYWKLRDPSA